MQESSNQEKSSWVKPILLAVIITFIIRTFLFSPFIVDGASMEPTLHDREKILVNKTTNWIGQINRGDIVIIKEPHDNSNIHYVKRVIALPGDVIEMTDDHLFVNEEEVHEPYLTENKLIAENKGYSLTEDLGPLQIPDDHYFVMGDNRHNSKDSRNQLGYIEAKNIIGKSKFVLFPLKNFRVTE